MMRAHEFIASQPWCITEPALRQIIAIAERSAEPEAVAAREGMRRADARRIEMRENVAVIPVRGPIFRYANLFAEISGATSTEAIAKDFTTAIEDPQVAGVVMEFDSPGGAAAGINELARMIYEARGAKPIIAYASSQMASAAYWIGSAADSLVGDRTALIGSIGVLYTATDTTARDARSGIRTIEVVSSQSPDKRVDVGADEGRAKIQRIVDDLAAVFVDSVATYRDITTADVLADYGRGGLLVGQSAVDAGLLDRLGSLESVIADIQSRVSPLNRRSVFNMTRNTSTPQARGPIVVRSTEDLHRALLAGHEAAEISIEAIDVARVTAEAVAAAVAEEQARAAAAVAAAKTEATAAERNRILELQSIGMKGFEKEISAAIESGTDAKTTAFEITKAAKARGTSIDTLRRDAPAAVAAGGRTDATTQAPETRSSWDKITGRLKASAGKRAR